MKNNLLTREQAIEAAGLDAVNAVERISCDPTNIIGYNGSCQGDALIEWSARHALADGAVLTAYYYTSAADEALADESGWDNVDFDVAGYTVE
jgi:beta-glucanase (GH16 family)